MGKLPDVSVNVVCWGCGRQAPAGVCLGPHPDFRMWKAIKNEQVEIVKPQRFSLHPVSDSAMMDTSSK